MLYITFPTTYASFLWKILSVNLCSGKREKIPLQRIILFVGFLILAFSALSQVNYKPVYTPVNIPVNYTLPKNILKPGEQMTVSFSKVPKDEEIFRAHFFEEPLVPTKGKVSSEENRALVLALAVFSQRTSPDDFTSVTNFLKQYPNSRWKGALLADIGILYRRTGYYNKAMDAWQQAWDLMKIQDEPEVKALADRVVSELLMLNCWVGRETEVQSLLKEVDNRIFDGSTHERIVDCKTALWLMKNRPGISFKCGPYALSKLYTIKDSTKAFNDKMMTAQSPTKGFSLFQLYQMAKDIGLDYQMAYRKPGAPVIEKAVVHWKTGSLQCINKNGERALQVRRCYRKYNLWTTILAYTCRS